MMPCFTQGWPLRRLARLLHSTPLPETQNVAPPWRPSSILDEFVLRNIGEYVHVSLMTAIDGCREKLGPSVYGS